MPSLPYFPHEHEDSILFRNKLSFFIYLIDIFIVCRGTLIVTPINTAVLVGTRTQLNCTSNAAQIYIWYHTPVASDQQTLVLGATCDFFAGGMKDANKFYNLVNSPAGVCDLIILNATSDVAGTYTCQDASLGHPNSASAKLVVLSKLISSTTLALASGSPQN